MSAWEDFGDWRVEEIADYQGFPHLVGAAIVNDSFMIAEIRGAIRIYGKDHDLHLDAAHLIASAPALRLALMQIASGDGAYGAQALEYKNIARAALGMERL